MNQKDVLLEEVLDSWRRCVRSGLINSQPVQNTYVDGKVLHKALEESELIQSVFEELTKEIGGFLKKNSSILFLTNKDGIVLKKSARVKSAVL